MRQIHLSVFVVAGYLSFFSATAEAGRLYFSLDGTNATGGQAERTAGGPANQSYVTGQGNAAGNPVVNVNVGASITLYIWYEQTRADDALFGLSLDIGSSSPIVTRTGYVIDNPVSWNEGAHQYRWGSNNPDTSPPAGTGAGNAPTTSLLVDDANAVRVLGSSLGLSYDGVDVHDSHNSVNSRNQNSTGGSGIIGTSRYGVLTLTATAVGTTELRFGVGHQGIAYSSTSTNPNHQVYFGWGDAAVSGSGSGRFSSTAISSLADLTINVVPEPSSAALAALGTLGCVFGASIRARRQDVVRAWGLITSRSFGETADRNIYTTTRNTLAR